MSRVRAVLFDYGGVFTVSPFAVLVEAARSRDMEPAELMELVFGDYEADTDHPWHRLERGEITMEVARSEIMSRSRVVGSEVDPFEILAAMAGGGHRPMMLELVERLATAGVALAIVTNNLAEVRDWWRRSLPLDRFAAVIDSSEVGIRKPDPRIYHLALEALGVDADEAVFVDDHPANVAAAQRLGIVGVHVGHSDDEVHEAAARIAELAGL